jgi:hypothetical protein
MDACDPVLAMQVYLLAFVDKPADRQARYVHHPVHEDERAAVLACIAVEAAEGREAAWALARWAVGFRIMRAEQPRIAHGMNAGGEGGAA